ncbi:glutathione hydrolase 1 proenzyme-like [Tubulanus polymorphus]|uniref:glutathione hydrolase 1 proenzyme-like n=1 Tax=Tubulanus polymorphus TaxID=672921 RepID=UPI003DA33D8C
MESNWERNLNLPKPWRSCTKKQMIGLLVFMAVIIALWLGLILGVIMKLNKGEKRVEIKPPPPLPHCAGQAKIYNYAAVSSEVKHCSDIGRDFLATKYASAIDAAIATQLCVGVLNFQRSGIGGNMMMTYYSKKENKVYTLNAMGMAPGNVKNKTNFDGAKAITVPGVIMGYYEAHQKFGKMPWKDLFQPAIKLARFGFPLTRAVYMSAMAYPDVVNKSPALKEMLFNGTSQFPIGTELKNEKLAQTLDKIATSGPTTFYDGPLSGDIVNEIQKAGGIISLEDLKAYKAKWVTSASLRLGADLIETTPPPSGGVLVQYILNILNGYGMNASSVATTADKTLTYHRMVEAMKLAFGNRVKIADPESVTYAYANMLIADTGSEMRKKISDTKAKNDTAESETGALRGESSHLSLIAPNGDAVSMTTSLDMVFGSQVCGDTTGILYNDAMVSFMPDSVNAPGTSNNKVAPNKQPYTPMSPIIVVSNNAAKIVVGGGGGARATSALSTILARALWFGDSPKYAVDAKRLHNQKEPNDLFYEEGFDKAVLDGLKKLGHETKDDEDLPGKPANIQMIMTWQKKILAYGDQNYGTCPSGY